MYICICNGITEEMLETAAKQSASEKEVLTRLGVGNSCGICVIDALDRMKSKISNTKQQFNSTNSSTPN